MPYLEKFEGDPDKSWDIKTESTRQIVKEALKLGLKVEVRRSSFSDPGEDWQEIVINGVTIPGSRVQGY